MNDKSLASYMVDRPHGDGVKERTPWIQCIEEFQGLKLGVHVFYCTRDASTTNYINLTMNGNGRNLQQRPMKNPAARIFSFF